MFGDSWLTEQNLRLL